MPDLGYAHAWGLELVIAPAAIRLEWEESRAKVERVIDGPVLDWHRDAMRETTDSVAVVERIINVEQSLAEVRARTGSDDAEWVSATAVEMAAMVGMTVLESHELLVREFVKMIRKWRPFPLFEFARVFNKAAKPMPQARRHRVRDRQHRQSLALSFPQARSYPHRPIARRSGRK